MPDTTRDLTFCWWNVHNFAHHDSNRTSAPRWPKRPQDYTAKRDRLLAAFGEMFAAGRPDLIAVCEVTREAVRDLARHLPAGFEVSVAPGYEFDDGFQVAVLYRTGMGFTPELPVLPADREDLAQGTRPMIPIHLSLPGHVIRFVACHWTAFDTPESRDARERSADVLRRDTFEFLAPSVPSPGVERHAVVLGDLNEEPTAGLFQTKLIGRRDRESTHTRHWRDGAVRRVRLYNAAWRYLGEQHPHRGGRAAASPAGTYFRTPHDWRTFDHVLVSSGLLGESPPYLDESRTGVASTPLMRDGQGYPLAFEPGSATGISDHLPIVGRIVLPESPT